jgi:hypothetical protein
MDEKQEPVAWQCQEHGDTDWFDCSKEAYQINPRRYIYRALYTAPPQREWQGLTDEDIYSIIENSVPPKLTSLFEMAEWVAKVVEARLKEKNNAI